MSHNPVDKLVKMANQIGDFFVAQRTHEPASGMAEHLRNFWDPAMREKIIDHVSHGGGGLDAIAIEAVKRLGKSATDR